MFDHLRSMSGSPYEPVVAVSEKLAAAPNAHDAWDAMYRAAVCGQAQALAAKAWPLAKQLAAVAEKANRNRDVALCGIFGHVPDFPDMGNRLFAALAAMEPTKEDVANALAVIAKNKASRSPVAKPAAVKKPLKAPSSPARQEILDYIAQNGPQSRIALDEAGFNDRVAVDMVRDGELYQNGRYGDFHV